MKYGKKNHVNLNPLAYNMMILGQSKVGKSTVVYEICQKIAGEDGYLFLELGKERGADAIEGINYVNCPAWDLPYDELTNSIGFADIVDDIVENKSTDYKDLQVVVWDTYDQLIDLAEEKSIALYNRKNSDKQVDTINAAWGGYGRGEKEAIKLMLEKFDQLKSVGVSVIIIGHVKTKDVSDAVSGESYQILTSDQQQNYFNAVKKNMHLIGLIYIDREIAKEKTGKQIIKDGKKVDEFVNKVSKESRKIKFRDDSYCVDCGGRFADIVPEIPLDSDAFIKAVTDAILAEQSKSGMTVEQTKKEQDQTNKAMEARVIEKEKKTKVTKELAEIAQKVNTFCRENSTTRKEVVGKVVSVLKENGYASPSAVDNIDIAKKLLEIISD